MSEEKPDPLEEIVFQMELSEPAWGDCFKLTRALAAIRVLKRGHSAREMWHKDFMTKEYVLGKGCHCGIPEWPCPVLAEAAEALRGGK